MILATIVDWSALGKVFLYSLVAAVGITTVLSFGIVGVVRFDDCRRGGRAGSGIGYAALAAFSGLIIAAVVIEAIVIMVQK
jgi:hypothetical protein